MGNDEASSIEVASLTGLGYNPAAEARWFMVAQAEQAPLGQV